MRVFIVTATSPSMRVDEQTRQRLRVDLAKFFAPGHATDHVKSLGRGWIDARVEESEESAEEQHPAHRPTGAARTSR